MSESTLNRALRVAIIGAGPSGFYAAEALIKQEDVDVSVDIFDRLPAPYGLVRYGVAPDHQKIKSVTRMFDRTISHERVRYFGHVEFGKDLSHEEIRKYYDAVVYTVGASSDRSLNIPGEDLDGSISATEFVAWYNGHPDYKDFVPNLDAESVVVVGMGNVAVDVCRILAKTAEELRVESDIADHAVEALKASKVKDIYMLGRRGPAQAKFTTKELRELTELANADLVIDPADLDLDAASEASLENDNNAKNNVKVMRQFLEEHEAGAPKARRLHLKFLASPKELIGSTSVESVRLEQNKLEDQDGYLNSVGTGEMQDLAAGLVMRSVGYRGVPLEGVPFYERWGTIPNVEGRVTDNDGNVVSGEYTAGWIKRGPSGVIGTNKADAVESMKKLLEDVSSLSLVSDADADPKAIEQVLATKGVRYVRFDDWKHIDALELKKGEEQGRPRVKLCSVEEMLELCEAVT